MHKNEYNIGVINLSSGGSSRESYLTDPVCRAVRKAVSEGITVVVAAGNYGKDDFGQEMYGTITSPANDPTVFTVGSANTFQTDTRSDDRINTFSSRGPTRGYATDSDGNRVYDNLIKPDLVAPGNKIVSFESTANNLVLRNVLLDVLDFDPLAPVQKMSGTSVAAPVVSGTVALMLQKNPGLTPPLIKAILQYTAQQVSGANLSQQGAGLLNVSGALRLTDALRTDLKTAIANGTINVGDNMIASGKSMPSSNDTITGATASWGKYVFAGVNYILGGSSLFTKYQGFITRKCCG